MGSAVVLAAGARTGDRPDRRRGGRHRAAPRRALRRDRLRRLDRPLVRRGAGRRSRGLSPLCQSRPGVRVPRRRVVRTTGRARAGRARGAARRRAAGPGRLPPRRDAPGAHACPRRAPVGDRGAQRVARGAPLTRAATVLFCALVAATFGAFFLAQRLKHEPSIVKGFTRVATFSPNGDGRKDRSPMSFFLKNADDVSVDIVDERRTLIRSLVEDRHLAARQRIQGLEWDGRDDEGRVVPDGYYQVRVTLRREGRAVFVPKMITVDNTRPHPIVVAIGPNGGEVPEYLPNNRDGGVQIKVVAAGLDRKLRIFRTDVRPFKLV